MNIIGWPHTLFLFGMLMCVLIAVVYGWGQVTVRKQGGKLGVLPTALTLLGLAAIVYVSTHGNLFHAVSLHTWNGFWSAAMGTSSASAPVSHNASAMPTHYHTGSLVVRKVSVQQIQKVSARPQHHSSHVASLASQPAPLLVTLEGIASIIGIILVLCILMMGLALFMRHLRQRREDAFLDAPSVGCAACGQEGEFPSYRDRKGQLAHLCSDCVKQFQVTPIA